MHMIGLAKKQIENVIYSIKISSHCICAFIRVFSLQLICIYFTLSRPGKAHKIVILKNQDKLNYDFN